MLFRTCCNGRHYASLFYYLKNKKKVFPSSVKIKKQRKNIRFPKWRKSQKKHAVDPIPPKTAKYKKNHIPIKRGTEVVKKEKKNIGLIFHKMGKAIKKSDSYKRRKEKNRKK